MLGETAIRCSCGGWVPPLPPQKKHRLKFSTMIP